MRYVWLGQHLVKGWRTVAAQAAIAEYNEIAKRNTRGGRGAGGKERRNGVLAKVENPERDFSDDYVDL